jgi:hypothetical protein
MTTEKGTTQKGNTAWQDLVAAHTELQNPALDSENPHFRSKFASLAGVRNTVVPVLAKHGFAVVQRISGEGGGVAVETVLIHESGERIECGRMSLTLPAEAERYDRETKQTRKVYPASDPQALGGVITYLRRYSLQAACCVVGDDDDDGNAGAEPHQGKPAPARPAAPPPTVTQPRERTQAAPPAPASKAPARPPPTRNAPAGKEEEITVYIEKAGIDKKGKDPRYWVKADTGTYYSTFEPVVGEALIAAKDTQTTLRYITNEKGFHNVTAVGDVAPAAPEDVNADQGQTKEDDLPF